MKSLRKESIMCFKTKVSLLMLALFIGAGVFSMNVQPVQAASLAELQQIIQDLKAQIIALQDRLASVKQGQEDPGKWCHAFHRNLRYGNAGIEVKALQTALEKEGLYEAGKDASGKFGMYTSSAVVAFQERYVNEILAVYGLTHGTGFVGKTTRAKLNELYPCGITQVKPVIPEFVEPEEECNTKCQAKGYDKGICRKWVVVPSAEWGCKDGELDIGRTSDCALPEGLVGVDKTCCCQKEAEEDCRDENYECTIEDIPCCAGLKEVGYCFEEGEECICATCGSICRPCGNGVCDANENKCDCPEDCKEAGENLPPVIDGLTAPTQLQVNEKGVWTIKAQDPENGSLSYSVNWGDEYAKTTSPESAPAELDIGVQTTTLTHSYSQVGTYTIRFTVTDDNKQTAKTSTTIKIGGSGITCTDSDGGQNKYVKGRTCRDLYTLEEDSSSSDPTTTSSFGSFCRTDRCVSSGVSIYPFQDFSIKESISKNYLKEYYCGKNGKIFSKIIQCENGCENGACKRVASGEYGKPYCDAIGSRSEGWYHDIVADRPELIRWDNCDGCYAKCKYYETDSEGWYSSCDNKLIKYENCGQDQEEPSITVTAPNGGETWAMGETRAIVWSTIGYDSNLSVSIALQDTRYDQFSESPLSEAVITSIKNTGRYDWLIPNKLVDDLGREMELGAGNTYKIVIYFERTGGVCASGKCDYSDDYFSIVDASEDRDAQRETDISQISTALELVYSNDEAFISSGSSTMPASIGIYLIKVPKDPITDGDYGWYSNTGDDQKFCVWATLESFTPTKYVIGSQKGMTRSTIAPTSLDNCWQ